LNCLPVARVYRRNALPQPSATNVMERRQA
jgi:hypothetical protein